MTTLFVTPSTTTRGARVSLIELIGGMLKIDPSFQYKVVGVGSRAMMDKSLWDRYGVSQNLICAPTEDYLIHYLRKLDKKTIYCIVHHEMPKFDIDCTLNPSIPSIIMPRDIINPGETVSWSNMRNANGMIFGSKFLMDYYQKIIPSDYPFLCPTGIDVDYYAQFTKPVKERCGIIEFSHPTKSLTSRAWVDPFEEYLEHHLSRAFMVYAPYDKEGFGRTVVEAAAMGIPSIVEKSGGYADTIDRGLFCYDINDEREAKEVLHYDIEIATSLYNQAKMNFDHVPYAKSVMEAIDEIVMFNGKTQCL